MSEFDGKRIAVVLSTPRERRVLRATARYQGNGHTSEVLRIELDGVGDADGNPVLFIENGRPSSGLIPDTEYGCDYQIGITLPQ